MILKALYDYYNRCEGLTQKGLEQKEIGYLIVIDKDGSFIRIESRMKDKKTAQTFIILQSSGCTLNIFSTAFINSDLLASCLTLNT